MTELITTEAHKSAPYIAHCPIGCSGELKESGILLEEGPLRFCPICSQLISSCSMEEYATSLRKWNTANGTTPDINSVERYRKITERRLRGALKLLKTDNTHRHKLLDIGCSSGALLSVAAKLGFDVAGVEPAQEPAQAARQAGFDVYHGHLDEAQYPSGTFDILTLFEIIEHISTPIDMLRECRRIIRPGGVLIINTPNASSWTARFMKSRWDGFSLKAMGGHISFFSPASINHLAQHTGFQVERIETRNVRFFEKGQCGNVLFRAAKIAAQLLALPARITSQGHDLLVYFRRMP